MAFSANDLPEVHAGVVGPSPHLLTFDECPEGVSEDHILKLAREALQQIAATLPPECVELMPDDIPVYALNPGYADGKVAGIASVSTYSYALDQHPSGISQDGISDKQDDVFFGIGINTSPDAHANDDERRGTCIHEILHPMYRGAFCCSRSVEEMGIIGLQKATFAPPLMPPEIDEKVAFNQDQTYGLRTSDFADFEDRTRQIIPILYAYAATSAYQDGAPQTLADVGTQLALQARRERRLVKFAELEDALKQSGDPGKQLASSVPCKPMREGEQCYTIIDPDRTRAASMFFDIRRNPGFLQSHSTDGLTEFYLAAPPIRELPLKAIYDFGFYGEVEFHTRLAPVMMPDVNVPMLTSQSKAAVEMLIARGQEQLQQLRHEQGEHVGVGNIERIIHYFSDGHVFELVPDLNND